MSNLPTTSFCFPHRCLCKAIADKARLILCLSDPKNAVTERKDYNALVIEYDRLMDERNTHFQKDDNPDSETYLKSESERA